jgi:hypothetical protein
MALTRLFVGFDYDYDVFLKDALIEQSRKEDSPFFVADWSIKEASAGWKIEAIKRIRASDCVAILCGTHTHQASGVSVELEIARAEGIPYFLLQGYKNLTCTRPLAALSTDKMYTWNWVNLKNLIGGSR